MNREYPLCTYGLLFMQLFEKAGLEPLLAWVRKHAERLGSVGRKEKKEPMALIESCVTRKLRY